MRERFFHYLQVRNLREGKRGDDGKIRVLWFDLIIGPFTLRNASFSGKTGSVHLNSKNFQVKSAYVRHLIPLINAAIKEYRENQNVSK